MAGRWTRIARHVALESPQRRVIAVLLAVLIVYGGVRLACDPAYIDDPQPPTGDRAGELADRLDPNTADWPELAALPGLGEKRAKAILARRDEVRHRNGSAVAFRDADDLYNVQGFGRSMVEQIKPYLVFPATQKSADIVRTNP